MATDTAANNNTADGTTSAQPAPVKKKRSPLERGIVWGLIIVGAAMVLLEARARYGYQQSLKLIADAKANSEGSDDSPFDVATADRLVKYWPTKEEEIGDSNYLIVYRWNAPFNRLSILLTAAKPSTEPDSPSPIVLTYETNTEPGKSQHGQLIQPGAIQQPPSY